MSPRLREIEMSEYDAETYESFSGHVRRQVQAMRVIIDSLQVQIRQNDKEQIEGVVQNYYYYIIIYYQWFVPSPRFSNHIIEISLVVFQ